MSQNSFLADKLSPEQRAQLLNELLSQPTGREIDLNKPVPVPPPPGGWPKYPKLTYNHKNGQVLQVGNEKEQKAAEKRGFQVEPSPEYDYSKIHNGIAAKKAKQNAEEKPLTAAELAELAEMEEVKA